MQQQLDEMKSKLTPSIEKFLKIAEEVAQENGSPEMADAANQLRKDYQEGRVLEVPWRWDQCRDWLDV